VFGDTTDTALEVARATEVPESVWKDGPKSANAFIRQQRHGQYQKYGTEEPPDPEDTVAFERWLSAKPREWAVVIAARAVLRWLATLGTSPGETTLLAIFRGISASRFGVLHPEGTKAASDAAEFLRNRETEMAKSAFYAASAIGAADARNRAIKIISEIGPRRDAWWTSAILRDAFALVHGTPTQVLVRAPLWLPPTEGGTPPAVQQAWRNLAQAILSSGKHWRVWTDWYDYLLEGSPPATQRGDRWETAFIDLPEPLPWGAGAESVNTEIAARLRAQSVLRSETDQPSEIQSPEIPPQGYGPHFEIGEDGVISFAPPQSLDRQGNNVARLTKLHPICARCPRTWWRRSAAATFLIVLCAIERRHTGR
jgi:hypothetical protein